MSVGLLMDKTLATRRRPTTSGIDANGKFTDDATNDLAIKCHPSRPKGDEVLPGGIHVEAGDVFVHLEDTLDVKEDDILEFWNRRYQVKVVIRPEYGVLKATVNYRRKKLLARELGPS